MSLGATPKALGRKPGPGRPKGRPPTRYVSIESLTAAIQERLGCSFQDAYADLMGQAREAYVEGTDRSLYPKLMIATANKIVENPVQKTEDVPPETSEMTDEELIARAKQASERLFPMKEAA